MCSRKRDRGRRAITSLEKRSISIKDLPKSDQPRERLARLGEQALSTPELIAIALGSGTHEENALRLAERLLVTFGGLPGLAQASIDELANVRGIGPAKAAQVQAALEIGQRLFASQQEERSRIVWPGDAARLLIPQMGYLEEEELRTVLLDTRNYLLDVRTISTRNWNNGALGVRNVFRPAIEANAAAIIAAHNHVNGEGLEPSVADIVFTRELVKAGELLDIELIDHLIIAKQSYVSLKERGAGFED